MKYAKPRIPRGLLHKIEEIVPGGSYDQAAGGQWKPTTPAAKTFDGCIMPVNNEDLQYAEAGTYTKNSMKLYTNGYAVRPGQMIRDTFDGQEYTASGNLVSGCTWFARSTGMPMAAEMSAASVFLSSVIVTAGLPPLSSPPHSA